MNTDHAWVFGSAPLLAMMPVSLQFKHRGYPLVPQCIPAVSGAPDDQSGICAGYLEGAGHRGRRDGPSVPVAAVSHADSLAGNFVHDLRAGALFFWGSARRHAAPVREHGRPGAACRSAQPLEKATRVSRLNCISCSP